MDNNTQRPIKIFLANCDWRNMFGDSHLEFIDKLERDRLGAKINDFFIFSWSRKSYSKKISNLETVHIATKLDKFRPILDLYCLFYLPYFVLKNKIKADIWLSYDFDFIPALFIVKLLRRGKVYLCLNNQPRIYSATRSFGFIKSAYSFIIERIFWVLIDHFLTINNTMKDYITRLGVSHRKISVFSMNTIERDAIFIENAKRNLIRDKYRIPQNAKIILTVARLEPEKNYSELLNLFAGLPDNYYLFSLGRGGLLETLKDQCKKLGIDRRVYFEGFVDRENIWNYYIDSDVFVLISKAEALGVVFWEAMYMNIPVLGGDIDGIKESIGNDGERGRIWKFGGSEEKFRGIIEDLTSGNDKVQSMIKRANDFVDKQIKNKVNINSVFYENKE